MDNQPRTPRYPKRRLATNPLTNPDDRVLAGPQPPVTMIMPIRNEGAYITRSLSSVLAQDYPAGLLEVLVVHGMSSDSTRHIVRLTTETSRFATRLLDNLNLIVSTALNIGLTQAKGEVIVLVGGHCGISPDCVKLLEHNGVDCVGGAIETVGETTTARTIAVAMSSPFGVGAVSFRMVQEKDRLVDTVAFGAYTGSVFDRVGQFDEELVRNQDDEFNYRLRKHGGRILTSPAISCPYCSGAQHCSYGGNTIGMAFGKCV